MKHVIGSLAAALALAVAMTLPADGQQSQAKPQGEVVSPAFTARFPAEAVQPIKPGDLSPKPLFRGW